MKGGKGCTRKRFTPRIEFTENAYHILEAAATVVLSRLRLIDGQFVTKEDLIDYAWAVTFFYVESEEHLHQHMYVHAQMAMVNYVKQVGPRVYYPLEEALDEEVRVREPASERELDDPAQVALLVDEWRHLDVERRFVLEQCDLGGRPFQEVMEEVIDRRTAETVLGRGVRWLKPRDRRIVRWCLIQRRRPADVARKLGISGTRVHQILQRARRLALQSERRQREETARD